MINGIGDMYLLFSLKDEGQIRNRTGIIEFGRIDARVLFFRIEVIVAVLRTFEGVNSNYKYFTTPSLQVCAACLLNMTASTSDFTFPV